jgi:hypothetical protein
MSVAPAAPVATPAAPYSIPPVAKPVAAPVYSIPPAPAPVATSVSAMPATNPTDRRRSPVQQLLLPLAPVAFLALALLATTIHDALAEPPKPDERPPTPFTEYKPVPPGPERLLLKFHDNVLHMSLGIGGFKSDVSQEENRTDVHWDPTMRFGLRMIETGKDPKRLTFHPDGSSNNTVLKVDGREALFGEGPFRGFDGRTYGDPAEGEWRDRDVPLGQDQWGNTRQGRKSVWVLKRAPVVVTQHVEVVAGQSGDRDTCLIQYRIDNEDVTEHRVGLRFLLDTFIGNNDGVPFLIPGEQQLINTRRRFDKEAEIPDFIQARERESLEDSGTVVQVGLKVEGHDRPDRVTLGVYPNPDLRRRFGGRFDQEKTPWDVPFQSMNVLTPPDSCIAIYWDEKPLQPNESRTVGFTYGLGHIAASQGGGQLALTAGGAFVPEGEITVTAYVKEPVRGQTLTLTVPPGFTLREGRETEAVPSVPADSATRVSPVTWKLKAPNGTGEFDVKVESSTKASQTQTITIRPRRLFGS